MRPERISTLGNVATLVLAGCALVITALVVRRELFSPPPPPRPAAVPRAITDWEEIAAVGHSLGAANAPVTIVEFSDFQCPFCAAVQAPLQRVRSRFGAKVRVVFRHFPLEAIHPFALQAAVASECAADQGAFESFHTALFDAQARIGMVDWSQFAETARVADLARFRDCISSQQFIDRVRADKRAAQVAGIPGTPGIIVNGLLLPGTPTEDELEQAIAAKLLDRQDGKPPVEAK